MILSYFRNFLRILFSIALIGALISSLASASSPSTPSKSPSAEGDLICHTDNPAECYPKVFSPTDEFQVVHDDQDLPPGLHIQLDIQTGQKQAKINVPTEENPALKGLPVDRSVVVVDSDESPDTSEIPPGAPAYDPIGVVKAPKEKSEGFVQALQVVQSHAEKGEYARSDQLTHALDELEELSHDMYYGLQIAESPDTLHGLFCILMSRDAEQAATQPLAERSDFLASSIISSAVRNNRPALLAVEKSWDDIMGKQCKNHASALKQALYDELAPSSSSSEPSGTESSAESDFTRFNLAVLDGLIKSPRIREEFLARDGMKNLLRILLTTGEEWQPRRAKAARIVSDTFLDEDVGATLGVWPSQEEAHEAAQCAGNKAGDHALDEGCWEHHLETIGQNPADAEWSEPLLALLKSRRPGASAPRDEL